jgi:hypothetical protein
LDAWTLNIIIKSSKFILKHTIKIYSLLYV